jgi:hypothetical protein
VSVSAAFSLRRAARIWRGDKRMQAAIMVPGADGGIWDIRDVQRPIVTAGHVLARVYGSSLNRTEGIVTLNNHSGKPLARTGRKPLICSRSRQLILAPDPKRDNAGRMFRGGPADRAAPIPRR